MRRVPAFYDTVQSVSVHIIGIITILNFDAGVTGRDVVFFQETFFVVNFKSNKFRLKKKILKKRSFSSYLKSKKRE